MRSLWQKWITHQNIGMLSVLLVLAGLLCSEAAMSIGMIGLVVNAVFNRQIGSNFRGFLQNRTLLTLTLVFWIVLVSGFWSDNSAWLLNRLQMKLPFLLLPAAIVAIPVMDKRVFCPLLAAFFWAMVGICTYSIALYFLHFESTTEAYKQGHVLYTPVMHIRFSLMVAFCVVIGWYLYQEKFQWRWGWEPQTMLAGALFLFIYLHILAVRTGLVSLYGALIFLLLHFIFRSRRYWLGAVLALLITGVALLSMRWVPTLWNKIGYMRWSLEQIAAGENIADLSDSHRIATIEAGIALGQAHPLTGTGWGDIKDATRTYLQKKYPALAAGGYMPQSQYVLFFAATGWPGLLLFGWATLQPLWHRRGWRHLLIGPLHVMMILSFLVEQTLETQLGTAIYIIFTLLCIRWQMEERQPD
ncbi:MAG TPA: O-antigen ligase family protein [Saprospiraceae bacterium]|nr:O-antigen ligase family protein [Saprospiraceae bacterium]HMP23037.1 O-antigen ligase family protein [Saprospiraceae bacterium]